MRGAGSAGASAGIAALGAFAAGALALAVQRWSGDPLQAVAALVVASLAAGLALARRDTGTPLAEAREVLAALTRGARDARWIVAPRHPLAALASTVNELAERLAAERAHGEALSARLTALPGALRTPVARAARGADEQSEAVAATAAMMTDVATSIHDIGAEVERLSQANDETASSIEQMSSAIDQVAQNAIELSRTVESSTTAIQQMSTSVRRVAESAEEVQQVAVDTAAAATEMDRAIQEVGGHVRGASDLTRRVSASAEEGSEAVGATIRGIQAIREQTREAKAALEALAGRIGEIGEIATVIGGISEETRLLSLNAAIIASQAGDHGRAFGVVADQVKTLSDRTHASARQIEAMIQAVQDQSENAVRAMASGIEAVQEGVTRSKLAGESLQVIRRSAHEASGQVTEIQRASEEQALSSKHVASAAQRVSDCVREISEAMSEQSAASESLGRHVNAYLDMARQMAQATEEQRATGRYIADNSHAITEMIHSIQTSTAAHEEASRLVSQRFESLLASAREAGREIRRIAEVADQRPDASERGEPSSAAHSAA